MYTNKKEKDFVNSVRLISLKNRRLKKHKNKNLKQKYLIETSFTIGDVDYKI